MREGASGWVGEQTRVDKEHKRLPRKGVYEGENTLDFVLFCCCVFVWLVFFTYIVRTALLQNDIISF